MFKRQKMQFFTDHQIAASSPAPSPAAGGKRKRDDSEMCDVELRAPVKRVELESHQQQGSQSPVLSVASVSTASSPMHINLNGNFLMEDDEPSIRRFQNSPKAVLDPWAAMRFEDHPGAHGWNVWCEIWKSSQFEESFNRFFLSMFTFSRVRLIPRF